MEKYQGKSVSEKLEIFFQSEFPQGDSSIFRDLSLNFKKLMEEGQLELQERYYNLLASATALENSALMELARSGLRDLETAPALIQEAAEVAGIMGMNTVYYKFRSYLPTELKDKYSRAGLRMQSLMKPQTGKQNFEMMAMSVSVVNGCPQCIVSHEKSLSDLGVGEEKIHDLVRLAAVCKGLTSLKKAQAPL